MLSFLQLSIVDLAGSERASDIHEESISKGKDKSTTKEDTMVKVL